MATAVRALIPIRSFDGMTRLSGHLEPEERRQFARELADRTVRAALGANTRVSVITADVTVQQWAIVSGVGVISERDSQGLDAAATAGVVAVGDDPWLVIHADLPAIDPGDVQASVQAIGSGYVLAPSHDGGTSLIGGTGPGFPFQYGPGSFRLHLAAVKGDATILIRPGLALDLDRPWDLATLSRLGYFERTADS
jgi:2-phospho-L-lactate guanylyltransferase